MADLDNIAIPVHRGQRRALLSDKRIVVMLAGSGGGKALALDTPIPTPKGWRTMGDLRVGDQVFDEHGLPATVLATSPIYTDHACYRVKFDDGSEIVADAAHRWLTWDYNAFRYRKRDPRNHKWAPAVRTTEEIGQTLLVRGRRTTRNHRVAVAAPLQYEAKELPVHPYVLGAWLGDGSSNGSRLYSADPEVAKAVVAAGVSVVAKRGQPVAIYKMGGAPGARDAATGRFTGNDSLHTRLRMMGLLGNKHIPPAYRQASYQQRLALLRGLMDTDGYCAADGGAAYSTTREALARDVYELVVSLGIKATVGTRLPVCTNAAGGRKVCRRAWRIGFTTDLPVFTLPRKARRQKRELRGVQHWRYIVSVDAVPTVPVKCIAVDSPSHLYLAGESCIPTHNSTVGPPWLLERIRRNWNAPANEQNYLVAAPTFNLLRVAKAVATPYLKRIGDVTQGESNDGWKASENTWYLSSGGTVRFGSADNPTSLEGVHYRAAWCDEWGIVDDEQNSTVRRRLAFYRGDWLITTTPYPQYSSEGSGTRRTWLQQVVEDAQAGRDPELELIQFPSYWNPAYPMSEILELKRKEPPWRFAMFYEGLLTKPEGQIYDIFSEAEHVVDMPEGGLASPEYKYDLDSQADRFEHRVVEYNAKVSAKPSAKPTGKTKPWTRYAGMDFGSANPTAILWAALSPDDVLYVYGERFASGKTMRSHMRALAASDLEASEEFDGEGWGPEEVDAIACDPSGKQSILDLRSVGLFALPAENDVEEGIRAVWNRLATKRLVIVRGRCPNLLREFPNYRRAENGKPVKVDDHAMDALRYLVIYIARITRGGKVRIAYV